MDFAPYQESPETHRALSPPPTNSPRRSFSPTGGRRSFSPSVLSPTTNTSKPSNNPWATSSSYFPTNTGGGGVSAADLEAGRIARLNEFETSLPIRLDYEACLAYLLLPPAGGVLLLVLERKSDYVRFHAWQSALLFSAIFVLHLIFSWSTWISWTLFVGDIALIAYLVRRAYLDADTLDRCEVPFFGRLASSILDDE